MTLGKHNFLVSFNYVKKICYNNIAFWFVILVYLLLRQNYANNAFVTITYLLFRSDYVFCGTFE